MNTKEVIDNLNQLSHILDKAANKPENYNTNWAYYLEQMSWQLHKQANELHDIESIYKIL